MPAHPTSRRTHRLKPPEPRWRVLFVREDIAEALECLWWAAKRAVQVWALFCMLLVAAFLVWGWLDFPGLDALRAAGLNGKAPRGGAAFKTLVAELTDNAEWIILTAIGLFLTAAAGALIFGVRSAPDWLFKAGAGFLLLLVGVPAVLQ